MIFFDFFFKYISFYFTIRFFLKKSRGNDQFFAFFSKKKLHAGVI